MILYLVFLIWVLYLNFGDFAGTYYSTINLSQLTFKERFMYELVPFKNFNSNQNFYHFDDNILYIILYIPLGIMLSFTNKKLRIVEML